MRLKKDVELENKLENSPYLIKEFPFKINVNDYEKVVLEIGMGKGKMISQLAKENPQTFFIGMEKSKTVAGKAMLRAQELGIHNFAIICEDAKNLLTLLEDQVDLIWITFPDPWPKRKHLKRRLIYQDFLALYQQILKADGKVKFKTDNDFLFQIGIKSIENFGAKIIYQTNDLENDQNVKDNFLTDYEIKWTNKGKKINYLEFIFN